MNIITSLPNTDHQTGRAATRQDILWALQQMAHAKAAKTPVHGIVGVVGGSCRFSLQPCRLLRVA
ncbi:MAG: hypothetical protein V7668_12235 [Cereibacter changlensis]